MKFLRREARLILLNELDGRLYSDDELMELIDEIIKEIEKEG